ncbi:unnamed protein product [Citrullus colocynthis]|uniref:Uncharacterized protein n=1 Tax=Citrullus colocynthis TaxID=252529 RepID=A0ABP0YZY3_9ROSI
MPCAVANQSWVPVGDECLWSRVVIDSGVGSLIPKKHLSIQICSRWSGTTAGGAYAAALLVDCAMLVSVILPLPPTATTESRRTSSKNCTEVRHRLVAVIKNFTIPVIGVAHGEKPENFGGVDFKRGQRKMFVLSHHPTFGKISQRGCSEGETDNEKQKQHVVGAWKHAEYLCKNKGSMDGAIDPKANIVKNCKVTSFLVKVQVIDNDPQESSANASIATKWDINLRIVVS